MKFRKHVLLMVVFAILFTMNYCKKDENNVAISGTVKDPRLNKNVSGAVVKLYSNKVESGVYNSNYQEIASYTTSGDGKFEFEIEIEKTAGYKFEISKTNYFNLSEEVNPEEVEANDAYTINFDLLPASWLNLHVKNQVGLSEQDKILFQIFNETQNCYSCCPTQMIAGKGKNYDTTINCMTFGNQDVRISYTVSKGSNTNNYNDTIHIKEFETTNFEILY